MDPTAIASLAMASSQAQVQLAMAAKFAKMNAGADKAIADLLESANQNIKQLSASLGSGVGQSLDISI